MLEKVTKMPFVEEAEEPFIDEGEPVIELEENQDDDEETEENQDDDDFDLDDDFLNSI